MRYSVFNDSEWTYQDSQLEGEKTISLTIPLNGHSGFQILGEKLADKAIKVTIKWDRQGLSYRVYELMASCVNENTSATLMTTTNYEECKDFVTHKAPFYVYDALRPLETGSYQGERLALYVDIYAPEGLPAGSYEGSVQIEADGEKTEVAFSVEVFSAKIPYLRNSRLGMLNFFDYDNITRQHQVKENSEAYWEIFRSYVRLQLELRCTHIMLPIGEPVYEDGRIVDFDFSKAEKAGKIAREEGAEYLCGGHIAHWNEWTESEYFLVWDTKIGVTTADGYFQIKKYYTKWKTIIERNGWEHCVTQALADEPQVHNAITYRVLAAMFRKILPGVEIVDAVETTDLGGGIDIWVPKQDTYEKFQKEFEELKQAGETIWFYTCAFPAGRIMNRSMDLPLTATRAVLWMGAKYRLRGFLHWGFNYYIGEDIWNRACCPHKGRLLPAGDAHIVYPGSKGALPSVRLLAQRNGAEEYELLMQLMEKDAKCMEKIITGVCRTFSDYTSSGVLLLENRKKILEALG